MEKRAQEISQEPLLKISNTDVFHGTFQALWDVSLEVKAGEIVGLIGANTSGKSTLLDTISGLLHPAKGKIEFDGQDIKSYYQNGPANIPGKNNSQMTTSSPALQLHRAYRRDSAHIVTRFVRVGTYPTRNFATLGPL